MTQQRRDGIPQPTDWTRGIADLESAHFSIIDVDMVIHRHKPRDKQKLMLVEQKAFNGVVGFAQRDTLFILHQMICHRDFHDVVTARGQRTHVQYTGLHILEFNGRTPQESDLIQWDKHRVSFQRLVQILRFEDPLSFRRVQQTG